MTWKGKPLSYWIKVDARSERKAPLTTSRKYQICKIAFQMGKSERELYELYDEYDRAQLLATYQTDNEIVWVQTAFPLPVPKT